MLNSVRSSSHIWNLPPPPLSLMNVPWPKPLILFGAHYTLVSVVENLTLAWIQQSWLGFRLNKRLEGSEINNSAPEKPGAKSVVSLGSITGKVWIINWGTGRTWECLRHLTPTPQLGDSASVGTLCCPCCAPTFENRASWQVDDPQ